MRHYRRFSFALLAMIAACGPTTEPQAACAGIIVADGNSLTDSTFNQGNDWFTMSRTAIAFPRIVWTNVARNKRTTGEMVLIADTLIDPLVSTPGPLHL